MPGKQIQILNVKIFLSTENVGFFSVVTLFLPECGLSSLDHDNVHCLLIMRTRFRFPALSRDFSLLENYSIISMDMCFIAFCSVLSCIFFK